MKKAIVDELMTADRSRSQAEEVWKGVCGAVERLVARGERVRIPDVGTLQKATRAETRRRNPRTGETITIASRDVVTLRNARRF